jgi:hypothetical protein
MSRPKQNRLMTGLMCAGAIILIASQGSSTAHPGTSSPQDYISLDRRISTIEQKIFPLESRLNRLEQQASYNQRPTAPAPAEQNLELSVLRSEMAVLEARIRQIECGVVQLDERTTPERLKEARKKAGTVMADSCRLNPEAPIQFRARQ